MSGIIDLLTSWQGTLQIAGPIIAVLLILLGGIMFGLAQVQPAESRGRWNAWALSFLIGGFVVGAIVASAASLEKIAEGLLT